MYCSVLPFFWLLFLTGSHSLQLHATYITRQSPFPEYSITFLLDDIIIGYYDSETNLYIKRGHTTEADDAFNENYHRVLSGNMFISIKHRLELQFDNQTNSK